MKNFMNKKYIEQLHTWKKSVSLTDTEKSRLRSGIAFMMHTRPYEVKEHIVMIGLRHTLRIALSSFMFLFFVAGSVSAVADKALPGDALYTFKVNINEEIKSAFITKNSEKLAWQKERVTNRLTEIKTLAGKQTLTKAQQQSAQKALDSNVKKLAKELSTFSATNPDDALVITSEISTKIQEKKEELKKILSEAKEGEVEPLIDSLTLSIQTLSKEEVRLINEELNRIEGELARPEIKEENPTSEQSPVVTTPLVTPPPSSDQEIQKSR
jgi:hypothetical protein